MTDDTRDHITCQICDRRLRPAEVLPGDLVRGGVQELIRKQHPSWDPKGYICFDDLNRLRLEYVQGMLETEKGELTNLELDVMRSLREQEVLSRDVGREFAGKRTVGERAADRLATFGGSWTFIISFGVFIAVWIALNTWLLLAGHWDPYPYILLNLVLSCIAALQAPVIMMSQNRQESRDRLRDEHDYRINLKAELEVRLLSAKIDQLMYHQWQRLLDIQRVQLEMFGEHVRRDGEGGADACGDGAGAGDKGPGGCAAGA